MTSRADGDRSLPLWVWIVLTAALNLCPVPRADAASYVYRNNEYGIRLTAPDNMRLCVAHGDEHDTGMSMFFDPAATCGEFSGQRFIGVSLSYGTGPDSDTVEDFADHECSRQPGTVCESMASGLAIANTPGTARRMTLPDGWVEIIVLAQERPVAKRDPTAPVINYEIILHTRPKDFDHDLTVFRNVLKTVTLRPPS